MSINKTAEWADWDETKLNTELEAIMGSAMGTELDLSVTGFDSAEISKLAEDAMAAPLPATTKTKDADAGKPADPAHVSMTFHMAAKDRDMVLGILNEYQKSNGFGNVSQAFVALTCAYKGT